jgi:surface antigen
VMMRKILAVAALSLGLAACQQPGPYGTGPAPGEIGMNKTTGGALVGAAAGGLLGNQFGSGSGKGAMTALGVVAGGLLGSQVGKSLDQADIAYANRTTQTALETAPPGQALPWRNDQSGASGTVVPRAYTQMADGTYCREFQQTITVGGQTQQGYGTACKQPDGSWKIVQ